MQPSALEVDLGKAPGATCETCNQVLQRRQGEWVHVGGTAMVYRCGVCRKVSSPIGAWPACPSCGSHALEVDHEARPVLT